MNAIKRMTTEFSRLGHRNTAARNHPDEKKGTPVYISAYRLYALDLKESLKAISEKINLDDITVTEAKNYYIVYIPKDVELSQVDIQKIYDEKRHGETGKVIDRNLEWEDETSGSGNNAHGMAVVPGTLGQNVQTVTPGIQPTAQPVAAGP